MKPRISKVKLPIIGLFLGLLAGSADAAFTWPGCGEVQESEFRYQAMIGRSSVLAPKVVDATMAEPIKMAFDLRPDNSTDIYWVERHGGIKRYIAAKNQVVKLGALGIVTAERDEQGLTGLALDPGFQANRWIYVFYSPSAENNVFRISRFSLNADLTSLEANSEKVLIRVPSQRTKCCHTAGAMLFDLHGDLWITVGKNSPDHPNSISETDEVTSAEGTSGDATDMRGGIIRIHPDNSAKGYSIPAGNYGEYWSAYFKGKGQAALAAEYADPAKVLPEIYVKGARNPYSISVDPVRRWVAWGEFGPNMEATMTEEHNLVTHPVFGGYPYFAGGGGTGGSGCTYLQGMCELWRTVGTSAGDKDRNAPVNNSKWNKGPKQLPPVESALHTYPRSGAITGPIYRYDGGSPSKIKFPPHFDKAWMVGDHRKQWLKIYKVDDAGTRLTDSLTWFARFGFYDPLDFQQGPDGAVYVLHYSGNRTSTAQTHIGRIEYTGTCLPAEPKYPTIASTGIGTSPEGRVEFKSALGSIQVEGRGAHILRIKDSRGRELRTISGTGSREYILESLVTGKNGLFFASVEGPWGKRTYKFIRF